MCQEAYEEIINEEEAKKYHWITLLIDGYRVSILYKIEDDINTLLEAKTKGMPIGGIYSAKIHKPHSTVGQTHIHVYSKNNQLFSLNIDGTAHDRSHGVRIPNKVVKGIGAKFPNFIIPDNNLIEEAPLNIHVMLDYLFFNEDEDSV